MTGSLDALCSRGQKIDKCFQECGFGKNSGSQYVKLCVLDPINSKIHVS